MTSSRLNIFQKLTRQWDLLHPYNAVQLMEIAGHPDLGQIEECWRSALRELGLGPVELARGRYRYLPPSDSIAMVQTPPANVSLESFISDEMNRPFGSTGGLPFRPFVLKNEQSYFMGVVYHHWIADSISIRLLLREWFLRLHDPSHAARQPLRMPDAGFWKLFGPDAAGWEVGQTALDVFRWSSRLKKSRRVESKKYSDMQSRFILRRFPDGTADQLLPVARAAGGTMNDLFLAAMAEACDRFIAAPATNKRGDLALGVIVDLRGRARRQLEDTFGLFLGFTNVVCKASDLGDWNRLVHILVRQNRDKRHSAAAESSMMRMLGGLMVGKIFFRKRLLEFYRKRLPLAAGISNVNLNRSWVIDYHPDPILDYIRVSPTGPMLPLVFTPTTLGKRMHVGLTYRQTVISDQVAESAAELFTGRLTSTAWQ